MNKKLKIILLITIVIVLLAITILGAGIGIYFWNKNEAGIFYVGGKKDDWAYTGTKKGWSGFSGLSGINSFLYAK